MIESLIERFSSLPVQGILACIFIAVICVGGPLLILFIIYRGLRTGVIHSRDVPYRRDRQPVFFWLIVVLYLGIAVFGANMGLSFFEECIHSDAPNVLYDVCRETNGAPTAKVLP